MQAVVFQRNGGSDVLEFKEVADPQPEKGQVLVDVDAVGVNYRDVYEREGLGVGSRPPAVIGVEGAGTIAETGERVAWVSVPGSYAERVAADSARLVPVPEELSSEDAAAVLLQGMTAHYLANDSYPIEPGDWVLVHSAAGGVGLLLTQLAKLRGGRVIGTTSSADKAELARAAGADEVVDYQDFAASVREITGGEGAAAVYDAVGRTTFREGFEALRPTGRMILYGAASGQPDPLDPMMLRAAGAVYLQRASLTTYTRTPELLRQRATEVFELITGGQLQLRIGGRYPLEQARDAHDDLEGRRTAGKLLLMPR